MDATGQSSEGIPPVSPGSGDRWRPIRHLDAAGQLWLAEESGTGKLVWLRLLTAAQRNDNALLQPLCHLMELLRTWRHTGFGVPLTDAAHLQATGEIAVEIPQGRLLAEAMPPNVKGRWPEIAPWALALARLLEFAAEHGLTDGFLHPGRIWLTDDQRVIVPEFGFSGWLDGEGRPDEAKVHFSPQVIDGFDIEPKDDIYGFGSLLYQATTGRPPFHGDNLLYHIRYTAPPPPIQAGAGIPVRISETITSCLAKDPAQRPATMGDVIDALQGRQAEPVLPAPQKGKPFAPVEFDPALKNPSGPGAPMLSSPGPYGRPPDGGWVRVLMISLSVLLVAGICTWMVWVSWPKKGEEVRVDGDAAMIQKDRELAAQYARELAEKKTKVEEVMPEKPAEDFADLIPELKPRPKKEDATEIPSKEERQRLAAKQAEAAERAKKIIADARRRTEEQIKRENDAEAAKLKTELVAAEAKFVPLFNGRDLTGWKGDTNYWSVRDGCITGLMGIDAPKKKLVPLLNDQVVAEDFELRLQFRIRTIRGNRAAVAGVLYRANSGSSGNADGYQFDLGFERNRIGALTGNSDRGILAAQGRRTNVRASAGTPNAREAAEVGVQIIDIEQARAAIRPDDWNELRIIARDGLLTHMVNGHVLTMVTDESATRPRSGRIGFRMGGDEPAMLVQFKDIKLRRD
jgi:hypothetical protein